LRTAITDCSTGKVRLAVGWVPNVGPPTDACGEPGLAPEVASAGAPTELSIADGLGDGDGDGEGTGVGVGVGVDVGATAIAPAVELPPPPPQAASAAAIAMTAVHRIGEPMLLGLNPPMARFVARRDVLVVIGALAAVRRKCGCADDLEAGAVT